MYVMYGKVCSDINEYFGKNITQIERQRFIQQDSIKKTFLIKKDSHYTSIFAKCFSPILVAIEERIFAVYHKNSHS